MKRFELSTLSLARRCSTTELHPQGSAVCRSIEHAPKGALKSIPLALNRQLDRLE